MPFSCYARTMPFFSRPRHSTSVERRPVGYLPVFGFFRLPLGVPRRLLSDEYQSQTQVAIVKPNTVFHGRGKEHTTKKKKTISYTVGLAVGYFRLQCGHSRRTRHNRSRAGARHGMCELTHGMAGKRHAMCESALSSYDGPEWPPYC